MSGIHPKQPQPSEDGTGRKTTPTSGASISVDTLLNLVLLVSIILVGWLCYQAFKRYIFFRLSEWKGEKEPEQEDDVEEVVEERARSPRRKDNLRFRK